MNTKHVESIPVERSVDSTLALVREGYEFVANRCRRLESDVFRTRLLGQSVVCMAGREAAALFYDADRFQRAGAVPGRIMKTLFGRGGVQSLDGPAHRHRKAMFMALMGSESLDALTALARACWRTYVARWLTCDRVTLFSEALEIQCRVACGWAGVPLSEAEVPLLARDLWAMVDAFGGPLGPRYWRGRAARRRTERWATGLIRQVRAGKLEVPADCALALVSHHRELDGRLLGEGVAAVELINVLRPIVAVADFVVFAALALHEHPECRRRIREEGEAYTPLFVDEVRRYYPFAPMVGARVRREFAWRGETFSPGTLVLLDLYGTNHDRRVWERPHEFRPERFAGRGADRFDFIPQGGGSPESGHRCAGEAITIRSLAVAAEFLAREIDYYVPEQDLSFSLARMPTLPESGFVMSGVRLNVEAIRGETRAPAGP